VQTSSIARMGLLTTACPVGCCIESDPFQVLVVKNTFIDLIDSQQVSDASKRSTSAPPTMHRNLPRCSRSLGFPVEEVDTGNHGIEEKTTSGEHGNLQANMQGQFDKDKETLSTKYQVVPEGQQHLWAQTPQKFVESWSMGSEGHKAGSCKPCVWLWKRGCSLGSLCPFCHLCKDGEVKARRKQKSRILKMEERLQRHLVNTLPISSHKQDDGNRFIELAGALGNSSI